MENVMTGKSLFYIGTYTEPILHGTGNILEGKGEGIYLVGLDRNTGKLENLGLAVVARNPSFLCIAPDKRFLYAVNELKQYEGKEEGAVSAFAISDGAKSLRLLNQKPTGGTDPCHVSVSQCGKYLAISNFMSGSLCMYILAEDGSLSDEYQFIQHTGKGSDPLRQKGPHAHSASFDRYDEWVYVPDLGIDQVKVYQLDKTQKRLVEKGSYQAKGGAGPRYCEFAPETDLLYLINELGCTVSVLRRGQDGALFELDTQPMLPEGQSSDSIAGTLHLLPGGRYLYASLRGENCIVWYKIGQDGRLIWAGRIPSGGKVPRDFTVDQSGEFLLVANQDSDLVIAFRIDPDTGTPKETDRLRIQTPVCVCQMVE
jgi:6-phosphogluconolactonase